MPNRLKRASFARVAVGLAVLAFPLLATSVAQAAIAGATPSTTTIHPDIRNATIDPTLGDQGVRVCFNKTLNSTVAAPNFALVGYRAGNVVPAAVAHVDPTNTNCVLVQWAPTAGDINNYTVVSVAANAVTANSGPMAGNLADSVGLTGSNSRSGVTGITTAPNLAGVVPPTGANQVSHSLTFVFDKAAHVVNFGRFFFETAAGVTCFGNGAPLAGDNSTTITIPFADGPCGGVVNAVRAGVASFGVQALADLGSENPNVSVVLPTCASPCATQKPDLISANLDPNLDQVSFTFDKNVVLHDPTGFVAEFANGQFIVATGAQCNGGPTCTAQFSGDLSHQAEFAVLAWVTEAPIAVEAADNPTPSGANLRGSANIGDNAGAFSRAFTTGSDVFGVTMNKSTGQIAVNLDDRVKTVAATGTGLINVMDAAGAVIPGTYTASFNSSAGPGPEQVVLQYPASVLTNATQVQFIGGGPAPFGMAPNAAFTEPFTAVVSVKDAQNVTQIVDPVNSAAILKAYHARQHHNKKHHSKRHQHKR